MAGRVGFIENDGWCLVDAEAHAAAHPGFGLPERERRERLAAGDAVKLMFDIERRQAGRIVDRGVDRMWVLVRTRTGNDYVGVLDSDPGQAENVDLQPGTELAFGPEHVIEISRSPDGYIQEKYGPTFFMPGAELGFGELEAMKEVGQLRVRAGSRAFAVGWAGTFAILCWLGFGLLPALAIGAALGGLVAKMHVANRTSSILEQVAEKHGLPADALSREKYIID